MKDEYDFSGATRSKFYHLDAKPTSPVQLDTEVLAELRPRADVSG